MVYPPVHHFGDFLGHDGDTGAGIDGAFEHYGHNYHYTRVVLVVEVREFATFSFSLAEKGGKEGRRRAQTGKRKRATAITTFLCSTADKAWFYGLAI